MNKEQAEDMPAKDITVVNPKKREVDPLMELLDWLKYILAAVLIGLFLVVFVIQRNAVVGESMVPNLHDNDQLLVEKVSKYFGGIDYGDIITVSTNGLRGHEEEAGPNIIKRVIGKPGDLIEIHDGSVFRNGSLVNEDYLPVGTYTRANSSVYEDEDLLEIKLAEDEFFVMGDNRVISKDSRSIGPIPEGNIIGEVLLRFYPFEQFGRP